MRTVLVALPSYRGLGLPEQMELDRMLPVLRVAVPTYGVVAADGAVASGESQGWVAVFRLQGEDARGWVYVQTGYERR